MAQLKDTTVTGDLNVSGTIKTNGSQISTSDLSDGANLVKGPASSTDNAIARFDGTTGKLVQNSGAYIDDSGNVGIGKNNPSEKLHVVGNIAVSGTVDGRDVSVDGAKLDESVEVTSGVVYKKFAKTLNITSTSNTVTLFTVPSSKVAFMGFDEPKIVIHSYGSLAANDAVVRLTYKSHSGDAITQDISLDKMGSAPYYNVLAIAASPKIMGPGAVTMSVVTAGTSGTVLIKGEVTW